MANEYVVNNIRNHYVYQVDHMKCWAACALTLYNSKFGRGGKGKSMESLFRALPSKHFFQCFEMCGAVNEVMNEDGLGLEDAIAKVRMSRASQFTARTQPGLLSTEAIAFFVQNLNTRYTLIGERLGQFNATDRQAAVKFIKAHAPVVVFAGTHLQIIVGYWDDGEDDSNSPQIIVFDPEQAINAMMDPAWAGTSWDELVKNLPDKRLLWDHFQSQMVKNLASPLRGVFHY